MKSLRSEAKNIAILAGLTAIFFWKILFTGEYSLLTSPDNSRQWYGWYQFSSYWLKRGVLPLWNPYMLGGYPFTGEAQPGLFYPLNLLLFQLADEEAGLAPRLIEWGIIISSFLLSSFQYLLARSLGMSQYASLVSAICLAFAGFTGTIFFGHLGMFNSVIWLPLIFLFFLKSTEAQRLSSRLFLAMTSGLFLGLSILGGNPTPPIYGFGIITLFALFLTFLRGELPRPIYKTPLRLSALLMVTLATAIGVSAVQLLPSAEYMRVAVRWVGSSEPMGFTSKIPYEIEGTHGALSPYQLVAFLIPEAAHFSGIYMYAGILPLVLCAVAAISAESIYARFFLYLLIFSALYVLGNLSVAHGLAYAFIPTLYLARLAFRALFIVHFSLAVLAGFGADILIGRLDQGDNLSRVRALLGYLIKLMFILLAFGLIMVLYYYLEGEITARSEPLKHVFLLLFMLGLSAGIVRALCHKTLPIPVIKVLMICLLALDLFSPVSAAMPAKSGFDGANNLEPGRYYRRDRLLDYILRDGERFFRIDSNTGRPIAPYGNVYRVFTTWGVSPTMLKDYYLLRSSNWFGSNVLNLLNVKYMISDKAPPGWEKVAEDQGLSLYFNKDYLPRAFVVPKAKLVESERAMLEALNSNQFKPREYILLDSSAGAKLRPGSLSAEGEVQGIPVASEAKIVEYSPVKISLEVKAATDGFLFLSEIYYPGWKASVDGRSAPILKANYAFRAVQVDKGSHIVELVFSPSSFRIGLMATVMAFVAWMAAGLWLEFDRT